MGNVAGAVAAVNDMIDFANVLVKETVAWYGRAPAPEDHRVKVASAELQLLRVKHNRQALAELQLLRVTSEKEAAALSGSMPHGAGKPDTGGDAWCAEQHHAIALASGGVYLSQAPLFGGSSSGVQAEPAFEKRGGGVHAGHMGMCVDLNK